MQKTFGADKALTLEGLNTWLSALEGGFGPVVAIGNDGNATAATFQSSLEPLPAKAVIRPRVSGQAVIPPGHAEVCCGQVFITGNLMDVVVYR